MLGRLIHYGFDAILISAVLAGIKRQSGLTPALSRVPDKDIRHLIASYLEVGEYAVDIAILFFGRSRFFIRAPRE